ncbi:LON peptidase substrate-binding domain-containing protein [Paracoccus tegillarcae]|uniref:ATP-dependent protease n=1 Tax=Paracoccus tegillarcae TaxID=1529068 RepID=A0A2K9EEJ9_9RHOB|nr:LON peptidase substrate-binding domain-containing protein [Paracoccus tegillarcae]AUH33380.1 ATP-dependent protease [Paracoccus tegillarcae]
MRVPHPLPDRIALFPLPGALLLPRARLPLQIFEPRYLQMLEDVLKSGHRMIGMIQPEGDGLTAIGCAGRVVAFNETETGRMLIQLQAVSRFRLGEVVEGFQPYLIGQVDWKEFTRDTGKTEIDEQFQREPFLANLRRYMDEHDLSTDWDSAADAETETLINSLSMLLPLEPKEKQALLEAPTLAERRELLDGLIEYALRVGSENEERLQ